MMLALRLGSRYLYESRPRLCRRSDRLATAPISADGREQLDDRRDDSNASWRPSTLQPGMLMSFVGFISILIGVLEYLSRLSARDGGIVLSRRGFPASISFSYLYLPTIVAVCLGMLWSWVDLDAKRLEPYFQLSKAQGAKYEDSLELHYPFDFIAWASIKAFRKRHWSVIFAGAATMVIFWAVTPLISAIFSSDTVSHSLNVSAWVSSELMPLESQASALTTGFMTTAYQVLWLGQSLPGFITRDAVMTPFAADAIDTASVDNATLTASTTVYSTNLSCNTAQVIETPSGTIYSNGENCATGAGNLDTNLTFTALYIGYYDGDLIDFSLRGLGCDSAQNQHTSLAFWQTKQSHMSRVNALFCEPVYWQYTANVTILAANSSVVDVVQTSPRRTLAKDVLNITNLEYVLGTGQASRDRRADVTDSSLIYSTSHFRSLGLGPEDTVTFMIGFALAATQYPLNQYLDPSVFISALQKAHQVLFALAVHSMFHSTDQKGAALPAIVQGTTKCVTANRYISITTEAFLGLLIALIIVLMFVNWDRSIAYYKDPASLMDPMIMTCHYQPPLRCPEHAVKSNQRLRLSNNRIVHFEEDDQDHMVDEGSKSKHQEETYASDVNCSCLRGTNTTMHPKELSLKTGSIFVLVLLLALVTVIALQRRIDTLQGLPIPSNNAAIFQLLTNYIPVIFATLLEPFWTLLNRVLCVLQPFKALRKGEASPSRSLYLKYTSLPPPLIIWRALRARHVILFIVCAVAISTNILTVALGALFQTSSLGQESLTQAHLSYVPAFSKVDASSPESFYIAKSNVSDGLSLPPWTSSDRFFLPFHINNDISAELDVTYKGVTTGFGVDLDCHEISRDANAYMSQVNASIAISNEAMCVDVIGIPLWGSLVGPNGSMHSIETLHRTQYRAQAHTPETDDCDLALVAGILRGNVSYDPISDLASINSPSSLWMVCQPRFLVAKYEIIVGRDGRVLSTLRRSDYDADISKYFVGGLNSSYFMSVTREIWMTDNPSWHNDTHTSTWFGYLLKTINNSTDLVNPNAEIPTFQTMVPLVQDIYARIFAIMLSLNTEWLVPVTSNDSSNVNLVTVVMENRLVMSRSAFLVTVSLLSLHIAVACLYYLKRPGRMLRRMPTTIASISELFQASGLVREAEKAGFLDEQMRIGYGKFVGVDGKPHLGIERKPFVIPWGDG